MFKLLALTSALVLSNVHGEIRGQKVPVKIDVAPEILERLTPEARAMVERTRALAESHLWTWERLDADLPASVFSEREAVLTRDDLFRTPDAGELKSLVLEPNGDRRRIGSENIEELRSRALIVVPSQTYPGRKHVWRVRRVFMKGEDNVRITFEKGKSLAYDQIRIQIPARWQSGRGLNVPDGARRFIKGWRGLLAALVGDIEMVPKYDDAGVAAILRREAERELRENPGDLDLRLFDVKVWAAALEILGGLRKTFDVDWRTHQTSVVSAKITAAQARGLTGEALEDEVRTELAEERTNMYYEALRRSTALEELSPGLAELLIARDRAVRIALEESARADLDVRAAAADLEREFADHHPVQRWVAGRAAEKTAPDLAAATRDLRERALARTLERLTEAGLDNERRVLERTAAYYRDVAPTERVRRRAEQSPARVEKLVRTMYSSEDWIPRPDLTGPEKRFYPKTTTTDVVDSSQWGWRVELARLRARWAFHEINRSLWVDLFKNGTYGYRAVLNLKDDRIFTRDRMNPQTGAIEPDPSSQRATWWGARKGIAKLREDKKAAFEALPDGDILSKDVVRLIKYPAYSLAAAAAADYWDFKNSAGLLATSTVALLGSVSSLLVAPAVGVGAWLSDWIIADSTSPRPWRTGLSPLALNFGGRVLGGGAEILGAMIGSAIFHPVAGAGAYGAAYTYREVRNAWDEAWYGVIRRRYLPLNDKGVLSERESGPGLERNFEFRLSPKLALAALRAKLEAADLDIIEAELRARAAEPAAAADHHLVEPLAAMNIPAPTGAWYTAIRQRSARALNEALEPLQARRKTLPTVDPGGVRVRLAPLDVRPTLDDATKIVEEFWRGREDRVDWTARGLFSGQWRALAEHMLQQTFGADFFDPSAPSDDTVVFREKSPDLGAAFEKLLRGLDVHPSEVSSDLDRDLPAIPAKDLDPRESSRDVFARSALTCETLLLGR